MMPLFYGPKREKGVLLAFELNGANTGFCCGGDTLRMVACATVVLVTALRTGVHGCSALVLAHVAMRMGIAVVGRAATDMAMAAVDVGRAGLYRCVGSGVAAALQAEGDVVTARFFVACGIFADIDDAQFVFSALRKYLSVCEAFAVIGAENTSVNLSCALVAGDVDGLPGLAVEAVNGDFEPADAAGNARAALGEIKVFYRNVASFLCGVGGHDWCVGGQVLQARLADSVLLGLLCHGHAAGEDGGNYQGVFHFRSLKDGWADRA